MDTIVTATITARVTAKIKLNEGETVKDFKEKRFVDIYLQGADGIDKSDLGADRWEIEVGSVTKVE